MNWSTHVQTGFHVSRPTRAWPFVFVHTGLSPSMISISKLFWLTNVQDWPGPRSLVTTNGVSVDVLSSGYLDISVHQVLPP
jgi:hypothetical protein